MSELQGNVHKHALKTPPLRPTDTQEMVAVKLPDIPDHSRETLEHPFTQLNEKTLPRKPEAQPNQPPAKEKKTRRNFLRSLIKASFLGALFGTVGGEVLADIREKAADYKELTTDEAEFYIFYESHDQPPTPEDFQDIPNLKAHLVETVIRNPDHLFNLDVRDLARLQITTNEDNPQVIRHRAVSEELVDYFAEQETLIVFEQLYLQDEVLKINDLAAVSKAIGGMALMLGAVPIKDEEKLRQTIEMRGYNQMNRRDFLVLSLRGLAAGVGAWALSPYLTTMLAHLASRHPDGLGQFGDSLRELNGKIQNMHPEDFRYFFRELLMSLRMDNVEQHLTENNPDSPRPNMSLQVGAQHAGIEGLLNLPKEVKLAILTSYPRETLNAIVTANKGLKLFCTTQGYDPRTKNQPGYNPGVRILDQEMYSVLSGYLGRQD